jgi:hypothetical protein
MSAVSNHMVSSTPSGSVCTALFHPGFNGLAGLNDLHVVRVLDLQQHGGLAVHGGQDLVVLETVDHAGDVADADCSAIGGSGAR